MLSTTRLRYPVPPEEKSTVRSGLLTQKTGSSGRSVLQPRLRTLRLDVRPHLQPICTLHPICIANTIPTAPLSSNRSPPTPSNTIPQQLTLSAPHPPPIPSPSSSFQTNTPPPTSGTAATAPPTSSPLHPRHSRAP